METRVLYHEVPCTHACVVRCIHRSLAFLFVLNNCTVNRLIMCITYLRMHV